MHNNSEELCDKLRFNAHLVEFLAFICHCPVKQLIYDYYCESVKFICEITGIPAISESPIKSEHISGTDARLCVEALCMVVQVTYRQHKFKNYFTRFCTQSFVPYILQV